LTSCRKEPLSPKWARGWFGLEAVGRQVREVILFPSRSLSEEEKERLANELTPITAGGFMRDISSSRTYKVLFDDVYHHVIDCDRLSILRDRETGEPSAFIAVSLREVGDKILYHLEGIIVTPEFHGNGYAKSILENDLVECKADLLAFHTQSTLMERLGRKVSDFDVSLSRELATAIGTSNLVDTEDGPFDKGRYGGASLYGDLEKFGPMAIRRSGFNYLDGDAIVFAGHVRRKK
jgi:hypothetical protein